ncbi:MULTISPECIES: protealysin inhibitor emfourin [Bacillus]|uniref:protealysin inhibitor emfourin n=1 Tax=Bacillus TaxID=1386 RepID=UPI0007FB5225|nr:MULTISPECIES: protealysin inhibitor emfourin [Bacillus cereus group]MCP1399143.1 oligoribonuclease NrnB/cAMP/cGMP phosphodiesterase (DHH superfamily) [Bacillus cereus]MED3685190.1 hypothetical protein [Bacillus thuringiensis]OBW84972.1 hypothetical protein A9L49_29850 [Bacillus cereus]PDX91787.1 hypothetical protein COM78_26995 [Bacillus thuringiensis]PEQ81306.1 hypothetical protein CN482_22875 [Bacillus cereus]
MEINFTSHGGFANLQLVYNVETNKLPTKISKKIQNIINKYQIWEINDTITEKHTSLPPSIFYYELLLKDNDKKKNFICNDLNAPVELRPLLTFLQELAINHKLDLQ